MKKFYLEKRFICQLRKSQYMIIYGAGMVGELTYKRLLANGLERKILSFAISKSQKSMVEDNRLCGVPICEIDELQDYKKEAIVIVATLPNVQKEIEKNLINLQFEHVVFVSHQLYQNFFKNYVSDFKKQNSIDLKKDVKKRILFMASDNNKISGAFLCLVELCAQLQEQEMAVLVVLPQYGQGASLLEQRGIPYTYIPAQDWGYEIAKNHSLFERIKFFIGMLQNYKAENELVSLMKEFEIDLVHCNTTYTYIGALAAKHCGISYVWHLREYMEDQGYRIFMPEKAWKLIHQADRVIAVSEYIKSLIPFKDKSFVSVIYDAVGIKEENCKEREILQQEIVQMIMVGGIKPYKRQKELIDACAILKSRNLCGLHLTIVGKGTASYVKELQQIVTKYDLERNVTFYGTSNCVLELYEESDLAFMCSIAEPYGRVTVEAQMAGCLVIGSDSGATPELIKDGETGYLYESGNPEALAEKIITAIRNPELSRKIAKAGQKYACKRYTKERNLREILDIYDEVLGK